MNTTAVNSCDVSQAFQEYDQRLMEMEIEIRKLRREKKVMRAGWLETQVELDEVRGYVDGLVRVIQARNTGGIGDGL